MRKLGTSPDCYVSTCAAYQVWQKSYTVMRNAGGAEACSEAGQAVLLCKGYRKANICLQNMKLDGQGRFVQDREFRRSAS